MEKEGSWIPILDYVNFKGVSISTVRRRIKGNKIKYRMEHGKYFIYVANPNTDFNKMKNFATDSSRDSEILNLKKENEEYKKIIFKLKEELDDLKMLVSIYENEKQKSFDEEIIPELPEI